MMNIIKEFNNQKGRFNRYKFWVYTIVIQIIILIIGVLLTRLGAVMDILLISKIAGIGMPLCMIYIGFTSYIKRLHDLDKTGWMSLLMLVPLANIYLFIICGFFKGTEGKNQYGEDPLVNCSSDNKECCGKTEGCDNSVDVSEEVGDISTEL